MQRLQVELLTHDSQDPCSTVLEFPYPPPSLSRCYGGPNAPDERASSATCAPPAARTASSLARLYTGTTVQTELFVARGSSRAPFTAHARVEEGQGKTWRKGSVAGTRRPCHAQVSVALVGIRSYTPRLMPRHTAEERGTLLHRQFILQGS